MADSQVPPIRLQLEVAVDQPGLLAGLEAWLRLGLISEAQVLAIAQAQLTCDVPPVLSPALEAAAGEALAAPITPSSVAPDTPSAAAILDFLPADTDAEALAQERIFQTLPPPPRQSRQGESSIPGQSSPRRQAAPGPAPSPQSPSATGLWLDHLLNELSVVWLLGLGVFLVVLSSAVLAATQWARFNAVGQYLVLLAYTLVFWGVGLSCGRRENLQLTAKTLGMITLLLVPLNFWALDALGVWGASGGVWLGMMAAGVLTGVAVQALRQQRSSPLEQGNALGLAYLHTGWAVASMPMLAVYLGVLGSAGVTLYRQLAPPLRSRSPATTSSPSEPPLSPETPPPEQAERAETPGQPETVAPIFRLYLPTLTLSISLGLLLLRAITLVEPAQWGQFGLAIGLYATTWVWLGQRHLAPASLDGVADTQISHPQTSDVQTSFEGAGSSPMIHPSPLTRWPIVLGRGLLMGSWLVALSDWLAQAFGLSVLGLGLRLQALQKLGKRRDLLMAYAIAVQLGFVGWELVPQPLRQQAIAVLANPLMAIRWPTALLGLSLFPYVVGMVALGDGYYRRNRPRLGSFSHGIALGSNLLLTLVSIPVGRVLVVNLIASTITAFVVAGRRTSRRQEQILLSYGLAIATILVTLGQRWPQLPLTHWLSVITVLAIAAILGSQGLPHLWGKSAWLYGLGLSALTYVLLWWHLLTETASLQSPWTLLGLALPVAFTLIRQPAASLPTTALALLFTLGMPSTRLMGLATAVLLSAINGAALRQPSLPFITVAYGLGLAVAAAEQAIPAFPRHWTDWYGLTAALVVVLWSIWRVPSANSSEPEHSRVSQRQLYRTACDQWGHLLTLGLLTVMTIFPQWFWVAWEPPRVLPLLALGGLGLALALRYWDDAQPHTVYLMGWAMQLGVAEAMAWRWGTPLALAVPTLALGALSLTLATGLAQTRPQWVAPLQRLTLAYAGLTLFLRSYTATAWTGWLVVGAALLILEVGRRGRQPLTRWIALAGLSVGWYELVLYPMLQAQGGAAAAGLIILAGVAVLIMTVYRLAAGRLRAVWGLLPTELIWAAHLHWLIGSLLLLLARLVTVGAAGHVTAQEIGRLEWWAVGLAASLVGYALSQGRLGALPDVKAAWVYAGLVELVGWFALVRLAAPSLARIDAWWGVVACAVAVPVYWIPWATWSWPQRPWRVMAIAVPLIITLATQGANHIPTLWVLVGFYGWLAWHSGRVRVSYLSAAAAVWAVWLWLDQQSIQDELLWRLPLGLAMLYIAQVDPAVREENVKTFRHWLRVAAVGLVLLPGLGSARWAGWPVGGLSLGLLIVGLWLRIRAFLYVGTLIFALNALNQLVVLNAAYPFLKWVIGIAVGVGLIWVAADFERRRSQWLQITQTWMQDLDQWQ